MPAQSLPPFLIISLGVAGIGFCQAGVNWLFKANKPNEGPIPFRVYHGMDMWDHHMENRDTRLLKQHLTPKETKAAWWDMQKTT
mmetsp:Transcript_32666/g.103419  ORF Transcript_32666/g.103419 Transcript_32666/m.103419 type:complete len:84 (-) Transcript_32666:1945-2196(-)